MTRKPPLTTFTRYGWTPGPIVLAVIPASIVSELLRLGGIAFSPDSRILATGSLDGTLRLWEVAGGGLLMQAHGHYQQVQSLVFTPDGTSLISGSLDGTIFQWEISPVLRSSPTP